MCRFLLSLTTYHQPGPAVPPFDDAAAWPRPEDVAFSWAVLGTVVLVQVHAVNGYSLVAKLKGPHYFRTTHRAVVLLTGP